VVILFGPLNTFLPTAYAVNEEVVARKGYHRLLEGVGGARGALPRLRGRHEYLAFGFHAVPLP
jgi:hypothetical protein